MKRLLAAALYLVLSIVLGAALLAGSLAVQLQLPVARRIAAAALGAFASSQMRGRLVVGRIDELHAFRVVARYVELYDDNGRRVVSADRVALNIDLVPLFTSHTLRIRAASLRGGTVHLIDDGQGSPTFLGCFEPKTPSPATGTSNPLRVKIERARLSKLTMYGELLGLSGLRAQELAARGRLEIGQDVDVQIKDAHARLVEPFGFSASIDHLRGSISTVPERGVALQMHAQRDSEHVRAQLRYSRDHATQTGVLALALDADAVSPDTLKRIGYSWVGPLASPVSGKVQLRGPPSQLTLDADLQTQGGNLQGHGTISHEQGVSLHVSTQGLAPARLVPNLPEISVRGSADIDVPKADSAPRLHLQLEASRYKGIRVPAFELDGVVEDDALRITRVHARQAGAQLSARGTVGFDGSADLDVDAHFPAIEHDPNLSRYVADAQGALGARLHIRMPKTGSSRLDLSGRVTLDHVRYGSLSASKLMLEGSARGDPQLPTLKLSVSASDVSVLAYALGAAHFALQGGPKGYAAEGEFQAKGQKTFYFNAKVAADRRGFVVQADPIEFAVGDNTWRGVARDVEVVHGVSVSLGLLRLASRSQRLEAKATLRLHGADEVDAQLQNFDMKALHALLGRDFPLSEGNIDATVQLRGDVARPELSLQGAVRDARVLDVSNVGAVYFVTYKDGQLDLDTEIDLADGGTLHLTGQGLVDAHDPDPASALQGGHYTFDLASTNFDLQVVPALRKAQVRGQISGALHATGTLAEPTFAGKIELNQLATASLEPVTLSSDVDYHGETLVLATQLSDRHGSLGKAYVQLTLPWQAAQTVPSALKTALQTGQWQLSGDTSSRRMDELPVHLPLAWSLPILTETHFDLQRRGGPVEGLVRFTAKTATGIDYEQCNLHVEPEVRGVLFIENGETRFSFTGHLSDKRVGSGKGRIVWPVDAWLQDAKDVGPTRIDADGELDFAALEQLPGLCEQGSGELHAQWSVGGLLTDTPTASFKTQAAFLPRVRTREGRHRLVIDSCGHDPMHVEIEARAAAGQLTASGEMSGCRGGSTHLDALVPIVWTQAKPWPGWDDARDLRVQLDFDHAQLRPFLDRVPGVLGFSVTAEGQLVVRGQHDRVHYHGNVQLHDGKLYAIATGQELHDVSANLIGNGTWVKIERLRALTGDGSFSAEGGLGFDKWTPSRVSLALLLENFPAQREAVDLAWLTGSAVLTSEISEYKTVTAVKLHSLRVRLPDAGSGSLQALDEHPDVTVTTAPVKVHPDIPYVLQFIVDGRRGVSVKRDDFEVSVSTELALSYEDPQFRAGGYVNFTRGSFTAFDKRFQLTRGSMLLDGTADLNPEVNMVASYQPPGTGNSPVVVTVSGTLAEPHVEFNSDSCPGDGAVVLLLSGRCPNVDPSAAGDAQGAQNAFAASVVGGILTLGTSGGPRISVESAGGSQTRVKAGIEAVPKFMRSFVQRVYLQGAVSNTQQAGSSADTSGGAPASGSGASGLSTLDFLIELYFPHNIVGTGRFSPETAWGLDVTWEP